MSARYQHVKTTFIGKASDKIGDERVSANSSEHISFIPDMLNLLKLDDCIFVSRTFTWGCRKWGTLPSTFFKTFNANTRFPRRASQTRAKVPIRKLSQTPFPQVNQLQLYLFPRSSSTRNR